MIDAKTLSDMSDQLPKFFKALNSIPQTILNYASAGSGATPNKPASQTATNSLNDAAETLKEVSESLGKVTAKLDNWIGRPLSRESAHDDGSLASGNIDKVLADLPNMAASFVSAAKTFDESSNRHKDSSNVFERAVKDWADVSQRVGDINKQTADTFRDAVNTFANIVNQAAQARGNVVSSQYGGDDGQQEQGIVPLRRRSGHNFEHERGQRGIVRYPGSREFTHARQTWNRVKALPGPRPPKVTLLSASANKMAPTMAAGALNAAGTTAAGVASAATGAAAVLAFGAALYKGGLAAEGHARSLLSSQEHLKKFDASIATSMAKIEIGDIRRNIESAQRTSPSVDFLADSTNTLSDILQPLKDLGTTVGNTVSGVVNTAFSVAMSPFTQMATDANAFLNMILKELRNKKTEETYSSQEAIERIIKQELKNRGAEVPEPKPPEPRFNEPNAFDKGRWGGKV